MNSSRININRIQQLTIVFLSFNLILLIGARALSYYNNDFDLPYMMFSTASVINFFVAMVFYAWMIRVEGLHREVQIHKNAILSMEEALNSMRNERHDFINHLQVFQGLIAGGNNKEANQYLKFVGQETHFNSQMLNIKNAYLRSLLRSKKNQFSAQGIDLKVKAKTNLSMLDIPPTAITTIFANLLDNAADSVKSLPEDTAKEIIIEIYKLDDNYSFIVADNGPHINQEIADRMFEPSFSTKGPGRGHGLSLVKQALDTLQGEIVYDPDLKAFNVIIPIGCQGAS